ncbi:MAG: DUF2608 domain-containing protein [Myxococcaceae bacterium]
MKNWLIFLVSSVVLAHSSYVEIGSMKELKSFVDAETLVIFDLDNTVFHAKRYDCHASWCYDQVEAEKKIGSLSLERGMQIYLQWAESQKSCPVEFVEAETALEIEQLQKRNIKIMALTSRGVDLENETLEQLRSLGLSFASSALSRDFLEFSVKTKAKFVEGILFVSMQNSKGSSLKKYFDLVNYQPKKIVFIDDLMENLESLEASFRDINFIGLHYPLVSNNCFPEGF